MFRTYYIHLQEDYIVHAASYGMFYMRLSKQSSRLKDVLNAYQIRPHVQYILPEDEYNIFETCRRQEELNYNTNFKSGFCWLTLYK